MRFLRSLAFPLWLAGVRLATRAERVALVALGIAAGAGMLAAVLAGSLLAQDRSLPSVPGLRLARVGRGTLRSQLPFGQLITRETYRSVLSTALLYHTPETPPFLVANGVAGLAASRELDTILRSYGWVLPVEPAGV